eukprot:tig00021098_g18196.t1
MQRRACEARQAARAAADPARADLVRVIGVDEDGESERTPPAPGLQRYIQVVANVATILWNTVTKTLFPPPLLPDALEAMAPGPAAAYSVEDCPHWIFFRPRSATIAAEHEGARGAEESRGAPGCSGLVFIPGALVPPAASAPFAAAVAAAGFPVAVLKLSLSEALSMSALDRILADLMAGQREVGAWVFGGHSAGGTFATRLAAEHPEARGLFTVGAYDLYRDSSARLGHLAAVTVLYGSCEIGPAFALAPASSPARRNLPRSVRLVCVRGANHEQWGSYTGQPMDGAPRIPRAAQRAVMVEEALAVLRAAAAARTCTAAPAEEAGKAASAGAA